jgi:NAD(P)-dependent dehydrogenase (short-subunit alcohol dehydrogenase family)
MRRNAPDATTGFRGSIICTASNAGLYPFPLQPLYAASKFAIVGLVRSLGPVYAQPHIGIRINALAPAVLGAFPFSTFSISSPSFSLSVPVSQFYLETTPRKGSIYSPRLESG